MPDLDLIERCFTIGCPRSIMFGKNICQICHWHKCLDGHCLCTLSESEAYVAKVVEACTVFRLRGTS
jgi:hypothetical protein